MIKIPRRRKKHKIDTTYNIQKLRDKCEKSDATQARMG